MATNTAPKGVGGKVPPRKKRSTETYTPHRESTEDVSDRFSVEQVDPTKIVIHRTDRPEDPPVTAPLVVKKITGGIRKCAGCTKEINISTTQGKISHVCNHKLIWVILHVFGFWC
ncbi:hypothetical protein OS493_012468 [Desmophyllum pertusum]|uniref:Uncharacterized protein n=1 Tax=Desmophyllum pertusum TaxID=174260 RepID=A0A9W9ZUB9_9CNID|nr:hypothetical protein OS493_012468 [Desmophyllum pertusum]